MKILYFGPARDCTGLGAEDITIQEGTTVSGLWDELITRHPRLAECRAVSRVAIDMSYATGDEIVSDAAELAIIPPVAGG